jgi:hypothetical protein
MSMLSPARTLANPRPEAVRVLLSDGSERVVPPWGLTLLPHAAADGQPIVVLAARLLERRCIPGRIETPPDD